MTNDLKQWASENCFVNDNGLLHNKHAHFALLKSVLPFLVQHYGISHVTWRGLRKMLNNQYCIADVNKVVAWILDTCVICTQTSLPRKTSKHDDLPLPEAPLQSLQIDFTYMPPVGKLKYLLVIVDRFLKWVEAFPCSTKNANTMVKILSKKLFHNMVFLQSLIAIKELLSPLNPCKSSVNILVLIGNFMPLFIHNLQEFLK